MAPAPDSRKSSLERTDANLLAAMSPARRAAVMALIASGEASTAQHALFLEAARLVTLPA